MLCGAFYGLRCDESRPRWMRERAGALNSEARVVSFLYQKHHSSDRWRRVARTDPRIWSADLGCPLPFALQSHLEPRKPARVHTATQNDRIDHYK